MSQLDCNNDFLASLARLRDLTVESEEGEWHDRASSSWIEGVAHGGYEQDPNLVVTLDRFVNNEARYVQPVIEQRHLHRVDERCAGDEAGGGDQSGVAPHPCRYRRRCGTSLV